MPARVEPFLKKEHDTHVRMNTDEYEAIKQYASQLGITLAEAFRRILREKFNLD